VWEPVGPDSRSTTSLEASAAGRGRLCLNGVTGTVEELGALREPYNLILTTPTAIFVRSFSGYFERASSASFLVFKGFDSGVNSPSIYVKSSHCSFVFGIVNL
jgi:hypothetical protein